MGESENTETAPPGIPFASRTEFLQALASTRDHAEKAAAAHPADWRWITLSQLLQVLEQLCGGGIWPEPAVMQGYPPIIYAIRGQVAPGETELLDVLSRIDVFLTYISAGRPTEPAVQQDPARIVPSSIPDPPGPMLAAHEPPEIDPEYQSLESFVGELHSTRDDLARVRDAIALDAKRVGAVKRVLDAIDTAERHVGQLQRAVKQWITAGQVPEPREREARRAGRATADVFEAEIAAGFPAAAGMLQDLAERLPRLDGLFRQWCRRYEAGEPALSASAAVQSIDAFIAGLTAVRKMLAKLTEDFADYDVLSQIERQLDLARNRIANWIDGNDTSSASPASFGSLALSELGLSSYPYFNAFSDRVNRIVEALDAGQVTLGDEHTRLGFLSDACECHIDVMMMSVRSAGRATRELESALRGLIREIANKSQSLDGSLGEVVDHALAIYQVDELHDFVGHLTAMESFFNSWNQPTEPAPVQEVEAPAPKAIRRRVAKPPEEPGLFDLAQMQVQNESRRYFVHLVEHAVRDYAATVQSAADRRIGLQMRAMRRWSPAGQTPTIPHQQACLPVFKAAANAEQAGMKVDRRDRPNLKLMQALQANALFQRTDPEFWKLDEPEQAAADARIAGTLGTADEFKSAVLETIADAEMLLVAAPDDPARTDLLRNLRRILQVIEHDRSLTPDETTQVASALTQMRAPFGIDTSSVEDFEADFLERLRRITNYFGGLRIDSPAVFEEMLEKVRAELIPLAQANGDDGPTYQSIERQLRAMRWWTANGRSPTPPERKSSSQTLDPIRQLHWPSGKDELQRRVAELASTFSAWRWAQTDTAASPVVLPIYEVTSEKQFKELIDLCLLDILPLTSRRGLAGTADQQKFWDEMDRQIQKMRKLIDPKLARTERGRAEIQPMIARLAERVAGGEPSPWPDVPEFLVDLSARLTALHAWFNDLMAQPEYQSSESAALSIQGMSLATLHSLRLAFAWVDGPSPGIYCCRYEKSYLRELSEQRADSLEISVSQFLPTQKDLSRKVEISGWLPVDLRWSPHGDMLAYVATTGPAAQARYWVGWCDIETPGELSRLDGSSFAWTRQGHTLLIADPSAGSLTKFNVKTGQQAKLAQFEDVAEPGLPPLLAVSSAGDRLAFSCRPRSDRAEIWVLDHQSAKPEPVRVAEVRKSQGVVLLPFWAGWDRPCYMELRPSEPRRKRPTDPPRTRIVAASLHDEPARVLYESDEVELPITPSVSPSGKFIAFFQSARDAAHPAQLVLLDIEDGQTHVLLAGAAAKGNLSLSDETLLVERDGSAYSLWLRNLSHARKRPQNPDWRDDR
jgi:hypothetical protein